MIAKKTALVGGNENIFDDKFTLTELVDFFKVP